MQVVGRVPGAVIEDVRGRDRRGLLQRRGGALRDLEVGPVGHGRGAARDARFASRGAPHDDDVGARLEVDGRHAHRDAHAVVVSLHADEHRRLPHVLVGRARVGQRRARGRRPRGDGVHGELAVEAGDLDVAGEDLHREAAVLDLAAHAVELGARAARVGEDTRERGEHHQAERDGDHQLDERHTALRMQAAKRCGSIAHGGSQRMGGTAGVVMHVPVTGLFCRQPTRTLAVMARRVFSAPYCPRPHAVAGATVGLMPCHTTDTTY